MRSVGVSHSSLPAQVDLNTGTESTLIMLNTFALVIQSVDQIRNTEASPLKMLTPHGITSNHTNQYGDGSLANHLVVIASLPQSGRLAGGARGKFLSENPVVCRLAAAGRARIARRKDTDFVGLVVCIVKRVAILLTDMLTSTAKPK